MDTLNETLIFMQQSTISDRCETMTWSFLIVFSLLAKAADDLV